LENPEFHKLYEDYIKMSDNAEKELRLPYEPENGNVEYKLKLQSLTMDRVDHLTTQLLWRLKEGDGTAFYQIGVLDSGQVTGLNDEELSETLMAIFYMASTLEP
jgi:GTPase